MSVIGKLLSNAVDDKADDLVSKVVSKNSDDVATKLIATHQITPDKLMMAKELGGFANPSLAVINPYSDDFITTNPKWGDIFLVSNRNAVDPKITGSFIGNMDLESPFFPRTAKVDGVKKLIDNNGNYVDYTLDNASKIMNDSDIVNGNGRQFVNRANLKTYDSIDDAVADADTIRSWDSRRQSDSQLNRVRGDIFKELYKADEMANISNIKDQGIRDIRQNRLNRLLESPYETNEAMIRLGDYYDDIIDSILYGGDVTDSETINTLRDMYNELADTLPTNFFEIKSTRPMYGGDFYQALVPDRYDDSITQALNDLGITNINYYDTTTPLIYDPISGDRSNGVIDRVVPHLRNIVDSSERGVSPYILGLGGSGVLAGLLGSQSGESQA